MPSPFPGMDPFLEGPDVFPDLHNDLIFGVKEALQSRLPEPYFASTEARIWVESSQRTIRPDVSLLRGTRGTPTDDDAGGGTAVAAPPIVQPVVVFVPEDEITETFLQIFAVHGERRLVTSIEVLSPTNKQAGETGRDLYLRKQRELRQSEVNLVEIDLLRGGMPTTAVPRQHAFDSAGEFDYHVCVRKFHEKGKYMVYPILLHQALPEVSIPLLPGTPSVVIDLQAIFNRVYDAGPYHRSVDYSGEPTPPLNSMQSEWARKLLRGKGLISE